MKPTVLIITIIMSIFALSGYINGQIANSNAKNPGFKTMAQLKAEILSSKRPIYYEYNQSYKSNSFRLQPRRVILFEDYTLVEMYAENTHWNYISREFFSYLENRDEGFFILVGKNQYNSTQVNDDYSYVIRRLPVGEKRLLVVKFDPIPRDSKSVTIRTNGKSNRVDMTLNLNKPKLLEANYSPKLSARDASYKREKEKVLKPNFTYDDSKNDVKINIHTVTLGHNYTYVDFELTNYAPRMMYTLHLSDGISGTLKLITPNDKSTFYTMSRYVYNGKFVEANTGSVKVKPNTKVDVRLIFHTIPKQTRRIELKGLLGRKQSFNIPLK